MHCTEQNMVTLADLTVVTQSLFNEVQAQVLKSAADLEHGKLYPVESYLTREYCELLGQDGLALAKSCVATMVMDNLVPLTFAETKHHYYNAADAVVGDAGQVRSVVASLFPAR